MKSVAEKDGLPIKLVASADVLVDRDVILDNAAGTSVQRVRVGGAKLTIDGSPQGFTMLRDRPDQARVD